MKKWRNEWRRLRLLYMCRQALRVIRKIRDRGELDGQPDKLNNLDEWEFYYRRVQLIHRKRRYTPVNEEWIAYEIARLQRESPLS